MASPPPPNFPSSMSFHYPSSSQPPAPPKRGHSEMSSGGSTEKRRKVSMLSATSASSAHPLSQTSFPPENDGSIPALSRSPSMDNMSIISGSGPGIRKKRPRKSKAKGTSRIGARATSLVSNGGKGKRHASKDQTAEEEDEDDAGDDMAMHVAAPSAEDKAKEEMRIHVLTQAMTPDQFARYEAWRSAKFSDAVVRRIVNQTLSQSVPPSVILAVKAAAKVFAGDLIEGARKVQSQWIEANGESQTGLPSPLAEGEGDMSGEKEKRRGPLLPDHLRESHRRLQLEANGGSVGLLGLWQHQQSSGVERFAAKVQGKRLFE